jgi:endonuclease YncB( thermonuclease family)
LILAWCGAALPADLIGQASIIDGDTLEIQGTRIRLWGIDAPECSQLCRVMTAYHIAAVPSRRTLSTP